MNDQAPTDELLERDRYKNYVLVSVGPDPGMKAERIQAVPLAGPHERHLTWGFTLFWQRSRRFRTRDTRHSWPKTAKLAAMPVTIGLCAHP